MVSVPTNAIQFSTMLCLAMSSTVIDFMIDNRVDGIFFSFVFLLFFNFLFIAYPGTGVEKLPSIFINRGLPIIFFLLLGCILVFSFFFILIIIEGNDFFYVGLFRRLLRS